MKQSNNETMSKKKDTTSIFEGIISEDKNSVSSQIKNIILEEMRGFIKEGITAPNITLEHPKLENFGDYSTNIAMLLAGKLKTNPRELAIKIVQNINNAIKIDNKISIEKAEVAGGGFINLWLKKEFLVNSALEQIDKKDTVSGILNGKKIVVEYTDPNPFKEFHIGHLISNVTGEAISRLLEANGATVWRADYFGDVGVHAAKSIWGIQNNMKKDNLTLKDLENKPLMERINYLGKGYALGTRSYEEDEVAKAEIGRLNTVLYITAQRMWKEEGIEPVINYDPEGKIKPEEVNAVYDLYKTGRKWSLDYFETIYKKLGTEFDGYYPESKVGEVGYKLVKDNTGKVFEESGGAVIFKGEKFGLHTRVFINKHNLPTYEAKELGLAPSKYKDFSYDLSIIVVGKEIKEYFQVLVTALKQVLPNLGNVTFPICTGMVKLPEGKMSSRTGNVVTVTGILEELKDTFIKKIVKDDYTDKEKEEIAGKISVGALKYAFLKNSIGQDFVFDIDRSLSLEGDSGPYLMYTYARGRSVLRKSDKLESGVKYQVLSMNGKNIKNIPNTIMNPEELSVLRTLCRFRDVVTEAVENLSPNILCTYLFELSQKFNLFYNKHSILNSKIKVQISKPQLKTQNPEKETEEFRLLLTEATSVILNQGLHILGIETVERM